MRRRNLLATGLWLIWMTVAPVPEHQWVLLVSVPLGLIGSYLIACAVLPREAPKTSQPPIGRQAARLEELAATNQTSSMPPRDFDEAAAERACAQIGPKRRHLLARLAFLSGARWGAQNLARQIDAQVAHVDDSVLTSDDFVDVTTYLINPYLNIATIKELDSD